METFQDSQGKNSLAGNQYGVQGSGKLLRCIVYKLYNLHNLATLANPNHDEVCINNFLDDLAFEAIYCRMFCKSHIHTWVMLNSVRIKEGMFEEAS